MSGTPDSRHRPGDPAIFEFIAQQRTRSDRRADSPSHPRSVEPRWYAPYAARAALVVAFFLVAFVLDRATQQQHSNILGSTAIIASVLLLWPWQRSILVDGAGYVGTWVAFALVRAGASRMDLALVPPDAVAKLESWLFRGRLPSSALQNPFYHDRVIRPHDIASLAIHGSFFVVPTAVALLLLITNRQQFVHYWAATALTLALSSLGFLLAPTSPPWLQDPSHVTRVIVAISQERAISLTTGDITDRQQLSFDPNSLAALPSVHVAAAVLVFLACGQHRRLYGCLGLIYALSMTLSVVYLGEHYLIDAIAGWIVAAIGWSAVSHIATIRCRLGHAPTHTRT
jgi:membrane-associated phospholipid phosphatase